MNSTVSSAVVLMVTIRIISLTVENLMDVDGLLAVNLPFKSYLKRC